MSHKGKYSTVLTILQG